MQFVADQLEHVAWEGFHFYDLIFPLFVFLMGAASVFSLERTVQKYGKATAYKKIFRRAVLLYVIGLIYYGGLSRDGGPVMFRFVGVLQRIAICYLFAGLILLNFRVRGIAIISASILLGYWALLAFVPVPGVGAANYNEGTNLVNWVDIHYLPGYKWDGDWDPEGLLSNLPAIVSALLGTFAGMILRNSTFSHSGRVLCLFAAGIVCLLIGNLWGTQFPSVEKLYFPIIKKLWTSSYVLVAGGWSYLLIGFFYLVIDVWKFDIWARPFVWIGMNSITIYVLYELISFPDIVRRFLHPATLELIAPYGDLVVSLLALGLAVGLCFELYRKKLFLRV